MKKILFPILFSLASIFMLSCGSEKEIKEINAVCIWDRVSLYDAPNDKAKWLTAVNLGERVIYLNESATDSTSSKQTEYLKIKLLDGKTGWSRTDFIILDAKPAVFVVDANYYNRPDIMTKSNNAFSQMDIVAVKGEQDGWVEIKGKRNNGTWIETGWVKPENLSFAEADLAVAKFAQAALKLKDNDQKKEALNEILSNNDFSQSVFIRSLEQALSELEPEFVEEEVEYEETDLEEIVQADSLETLNETAE